MNQTKNNRNTANVLSVIWMLAAGFVSWIFHTYLPLSTERMPLTIGCLTIGVLSAAVFHWIVMKLPNPLWVRRAVISCLAAMLPTPEAFAMFNALRAQGRIVVLIAHSTC